MRTDGVRNCFLRRLTGEQVYELMLEVRHYTGAHIQVGIDHITLRISPVKIEVVNFEHIKSLPVSPHL
ncbi:DUF3888 domain-containing protein [Desulfotomaculum copahuensis]|uniref:DUF3888 domain-containing protein n=1 Tax=Desulfotomaculum copahuensis TaxID=1838280 RepID=UPI00098FEE4B